MRPAKSVVVLIGMILLLVTTIFGHPQQVIRNPAEPKITDVRLIGLSQLDDKSKKVTFELVIEGENLPDARDHATVHFDAKDPASPVTTDPASLVTDIPVATSNDKEIVVKGAAKAGAEITRIVVSVGHEIVAKTEAFTVAIKENPFEKLKQFEIKIDHQKNKEFPNLHSLVITKEGGAAEVGFADNPHWMTVDLMPTGATDVNIVQTNRRRLDLHFVAAADYEPKSVVITVYNGSDLDKREPQAVAIDKKPPEDPEQPKIDRTEIVFINRSHGVGRIRIYGKSFGDYPSPPYPVDDYLWNCLQQFHIRGTVVRGGTEELELDDARARIKACADLLGGTPTTISDEELKNRLEFTKTNLASFVKAANTNSWETWRGKIREKVTVGVNSRNPDIAVERVEILDVNDKMVDIYFEFTRTRGYAWPFRLGDATVAVKKMLPKTKQTVKDDKVTATVAGVKEETYTVQYQPGPRRDSNLTYKYTVLDRKSANTLLGKGIADNFYVLQVSVVNNGEKKVTIPLASIQAEIEWFRGSNKARSVSFVQGPPTLAPIPLAAVSGYFDAYQKVVGLRAHLFNTLDAVTTAATALVPFTGPSFKDAEVYFSGGFVPAVRRVLGDLSGQQLQNLTSLSWESSETLPAKGGSKEKLIYIQRNAQFRSEPVRAVGVAAETRKQIASIMDLEITGFEVIESEAKQATSSPATTPATATNTSPAPTQPAAPASPATPAQPETAPKDKNK